MNVIYCGAIDLVGTRGHITFYAYRRCDSELYDYAGEIEGDHGIDTLADVVKSYDGVISNEVSPFPDADGSAAFDAFQWMLGCRLRKRQLNAEELQQLLRLLNT